jgi:acyl carrier protein
MSSQIADEWLKQVESWLLDRRPELTSLAMDFDLIDNRVLDSLAFLSFVHYVEELTGQELSVDAQSANAFRTLESIRNQILVPMSTGAAHG